MTKYFVSITGKDTNPGTEQSPFRTIQKSANVAVAGDTVQVKNGTYNEIVLLPHSGQLNKPIIFKNYANHKPIISGSGLSFPQDYLGLITGLGKNNIGIYGFEFTRSAKHAIHFDRSTNIKISSNYIHDFRYDGIKIGWSPSNTIDIGYNIVDNRVISYSPTHEECISLSRCSNAIVHHNIVRGNLLGEGIMLNLCGSNSMVYGNRVNNCKKSFGIYVASGDEHLYNINVHRNIVSNCRVGFACGNELNGTSENIKYYNNIAYNNSDSGFTLNGFQEPNTVGTFRNIYIINNDFYGNGMSPIFLLGSSIMIDNILNKVINKNVVVRNNITGLAKTLQIGLRTKNDTNHNTTIDHNLIQGYRAYPIEVRGSYYVQGDPMFVDYASKDFHLRPDSPAIDAGSSDNAPIADFEWHDRYGKVDIGAYEYNPNT